MPWTNYHSHSLYSDGKDNPENYILSAIQNNVAAYGFSCHAPIPFETKWTMKKERLPEYFNEINYLKNKYGSEIEIYSGLEIDFIPDLIGPGNSLFSSFPFDYTIGSIHYVGQLNNGKYCCIDGTYNDFDAGLNEIFSGNVRSFITRYFEITRQMLSGESPTILGHFDKIKMHNKRQRLFDENETWYRNEIFTTLETAKKQEVIIEINTRSMYKHPEHKSIIPSLWILKAINQLNIPVTVNSDAHLPGEIINGFPETYKMLMDIGFRKLRILINEIWQDKYFDEKGIIL